MHYLLAVVSAETAQGSRPGTAGSCRSVWTRGRGVSAEGAPFGGDARDDIRVEVEPNRSAKLIRINLPTSNSHETPPGSFMFY